MSTNARRFNSASKPMNIADLTVGQRLIQVTTYTNWNNGPIVRRETLVRVEKITKTRLVVKTAQGTVYRVLVDNGDWNKGYVRDVLEGQANYNLSAREDFLLYTEDDSDLRVDREYTRTHNAKAVPRMEAKSAIAGAAKDLTKESALDAIQALQAYVATLDA